MLSSQNKHEWSAWPSHLCMKRSNRTIHSFGIIAFTVSRTEEKHFLADKKSHDTTSPCTTCILQQRWQTLSDTKKQSNYIGVNVLLIQRKLTNAFYDILTGRYSIDPSSVSRQHIITLLSELTCDERWQILNCKSFLNLTADLRISIKHKQFLAKQFYENRPYLCSLISTLYPFLMHYQSREYGFPKGRKNKNETRYDCAIREFCEETGYKSHHITPLTNINQSFQETFQGSDGIIYCHHYFLAIIHTPIANDIHRQNNNEIRSVGWYPMAAAVKLLTRRQYDKTKLLVLDEAYKCIMNTRSFKNYVRKN